MKMRTKLSAAMVTVVLGFSSNAALAAGTVEITLWDNPAMTMAMNMGPGMGGDPAMAAMGITLTPITVTAGDVTFNVTNASTLMPHEMVVIPIATADTVPPYDATAMEVDEAAAGALGEVPELAPGATGAVTLNLPAGTYILVCNVPGHYAAGMWVILTVTP